MLIIHHILIVLMLNDAFQVVPCPSTTLIVVSSLIEELKIYK